MAFRRSVDPNVRRRRVLKDETPAEPEETSEGNGNRRSRSAQSLGRNYADSALTDHQPRITDFIPVRWWQQALLFILAVGGIVAVQSLFLKLETWAAAVGRENLTAFDLNQRGSIASWLSSLLLGGAFAGALLVFSIRRHKVTDYRGRYRVWIFVAGLLLLGSMDAATGVRHAVRGALELLMKKYAATTFLATHTSLCLAILAGTLAAVAIVRVAIEVRQSRAALTFLTLAALSYLTAVLGTFGLIQWASGPVMHVIDSTLKLTGDLAAFFATLSYARYVYLDAMGALDVRKAKKKKARKKTAAETKTVAESADDDEEETVPETKKPTTTPTTHAPSTTTHVPVKTDAKSGHAPTHEVKPGLKPGPLTVKPTTQAPSADQDDEDDEEGDDTSGLSRAERKRLKKLARRESRNAA